MVQKKKIAFLGLKGMPPKFGGFQFDAEMIGEYLIREGFDVLVLCRRWYQGEYKGNEYRSMKLKIVNTPKSPVFLDVLIHNLYSCYYSIKEKADVVYLFGSHTFFLIPIFKLFGIKSVIRRAGFAKTTNSYNLFSRYLIMLNEMIGIHFSDVITTETIVEKNQIEKYTKKNILITPVGFVGREKIQPQLITDRYGLYRNGYILFIGRFVKVKRIEWLINSFKSLITTNNLKLVIAGSSLDENYFHYLKTLGNDERIIFTGVVNGQLKDELIANCFCMVLPSQSEGMSTAVAETLAFGSVCLLSDIDVHRWIINDPEVGLLFDKDNPDDLTGKLAGLINNTYSFNETIIREKSLERFHIEKIMKVVVGIIHDLTESKKN